MLNNNQLIALIAQLEIEADAEREDSGDYESMTRTCVTLREIIPTQPVRSYGIARALYEAHTSQDIMILHGFDIRKKISALIRWRFKNSSSEYAS
jgi:hypothetical protein